MYDSDLRGFLILCLKAILSLDNANKCSCVKLRFSKRGSHSSSIYNTVGQLLQKYFSAVEKVDCAPRNLRRVQPVPRQK